METNWVDRPLRWAAGMAFFCYICWNLWWIVWQGKIPPSILKFCTGIPAPTSGMVRSLQHFVAGDWEAAWMYNPCTLPVLFLLAVSAGSLILRYARKKPLLLPQSIQMAWPSTLGLAWLLKFVLGPSWY